MSLTSRVLLLLLFLKIHFFLQLEANYVKRESRAYLECL